jgi:hypothetical protein
MPSGWTRMILERFEFPFKVVYPPEMDKGELRANYDVLVLVDGAIPGRGLAGLRSGGFGAAAPPESIPEEYRNQRGSITQKTTAPQLRAFLDNGGTIFTIGSSTGITEQLGLPLKSHLVETVDGKETPLTRQKFFVPGSVLQARVDTAHPLAWGMEEQVDVMFSSSPTFRQPDGADAKSFRRVAWYDGKAPLRSGWAWGQEHLDGGIAVAELPVGKGRLVLCGPQVLFRAQPEASFKLLFNSIVQAGVKE